ncbi:hypothetical protein Ancab_012360, partial [Ancistrocladus abbreviatus]
GVSLKRNVNTLGSSQVQLGLVPVVVQNELIFNKMKIGARKLFEKIQALSYEWIPVKGNNK